MTKPARPPLDLGEALTRNRITTWSGLNKMIFAGLIFSTNMYLFLRASHICRETRLSPALCESLLTESLGPGLV